MSANRASTDTPGSTLDPGAASPATDSGPGRGATARKLRKARNRVLRRALRLVGRDPGPGGERNKWERYRLPEDMSGKTFLDVGCWEGVNCAEATRRGAKRVVGVDLCTSEELARNVDRYGFEFLQLDVLSEKWLELDRFDIVLCSGVLYHVENVLSLLFRLRSVTDELLVLETATRELPTEEPVLVFKPSDEEGGNPSNWWVPNRACLFEMVRACGFAEPGAVWERQRPNGSRLCIHARPAEPSSYDRILPRKPEAMSVAGGSRSFDGAGE